MHAIVLIIDKYYFRHACFLVESLAKNYQSHPDIVVFYKNLSTKQQGRLNGCRRVRLIEVTGLVSWTTALMDAHRRMKVDPSIIGARYLLWSDILDEYDKVIYLDADMIVLGNMDEMFQRDHFVMIRQPGKNRLLRRENCEEVESLLARDGIERTKEAGNSGVMMLPRILRSKENLEQLLDINVRYQEYLEWQDQTTINLWCRRNNIELSDDYHYNYCIRNHKQYPGTVRREAVKVLHFNDMIENEVNRLRLMKEALNLKSEPTEISRFLDKAYKSYKFGKSPGMEAALRVGSWIRRRG